MAFAEAVLPTAIGKIFALYIPAHWDVAKRIGLAPENFETSFDTFNLIVFHCKKQISHNFMDNDVATL